MPAVACASHPALRRRRPFPPEGGIGIDGQTPKIEPESTRRRGPGRTARHVEKSRERHRHRRQIGDRETRSACPRSGLRAKVPARYRRDQGPGPGLPHGSHTPREPSVSASTGDPEHVSDLFPGRTERASTTDGEHLGFIGHVASGDREPHDVVGVRKGPLVLVQEIEQARERIGRQTSRRRGRDQRIPVHLNTPSCTSRASDQTQPHSSSAAWW